MTRYLVSQNNRRLRILDQSRTSWSLDDWQLWAIPAVLTVIIVWLAYQVFITPEWVMTKTGGRHLSHVYGNDAYWVAAMALPLLAIIFMNLKAHPFVLEINKRQIRLGKKRISVDRSKEIEWRMQTMRFVDQHGNNQTIQFDEREYGVETIKQIKAWVQSHYSFIER